MTAVICSCGYSREPYANGLEACLHCDTGVCESKCARCRTYDVALSKRISA